ncbi:MAG: NAD(P)-dependent oxidoreductase [Candidatus Cloacimonetes bacterium]|nr:NAD(P)-dependent oxidoreductase [Candidatus Cloacimonadota bacterium]MBS3766759.1 NAD(P)-dependent oxidoreductase [Candidatus Cloacimonadota bacterium]
MKILVTGITGFIGGKVCDKLIENNHKTIVSLIRPGTKKSRYREYDKNGVKCEFIELIDKNSIKRIFNKYKFDIVYHIAAIRGGRNLPKKQYFDVNVNSTKYIAEECIKNNSKMIFCSSVGVFGAIPKELPPDENTPRQDDNYYHYTKIEAENILQRLVKQNLELIIIRPSITYGIGDFGFPFNLIKLVDKGMMFLSSNDIKINMVNLNTLTKAFIQAGKTKLNSGNAYNIADKNPISLKKLVNHINYKLKGKKYPFWKVIPKFIFNFFDFIFSNILKNELWKARIELISKSWYYDVTPAEQDLRFKAGNTIPDFNYVIDWYKDFKKEEQ